jgi:hypothetical protein
MNYKDVVKEIKRKLRPLELVYESYEDFERRKTSDEAIKKYIVLFIQGYIDKIAVLQNIALQSQMIMLWSDIDRLVAQLKDMNLFINNTSYEGSTFFIAQRKASEIFAILAESELAILDITTELEIRLLSYKDAIDSALLSNSSKIIGEISKLLNQIQSLWTIRHEGILKFRFIS